MAEPPLTLTDKLKAVSDRFQARIDAKAAEIKAACSSFLKAGGDRETLSALREAINLSHRLAGSAGSMGFGEIGDASKALELALLDVKQGQGAPLGEKRIRIERALGDLTEAARNKNREDIVAPKTTPPGGEIPVRDRSEKPVI